MPLVTIQATRLSADQKKRIGDRIMEAFHREGIPASSVVILYTHRDMDILLDGGYLIEATLDPQPQLPIPKPAVLPPRGSGSA